MLMLPFTQTQSGWDTACTAMMNAVRENIAFRQSPFTLSLINTTADFIHSCLTVCNILYYTILASF